MHLALMVYARTVPYYFEAKAHCSVSQRERVMDPMYYEVFCDGGYPGMHYEIELVSPVWTWPHFDNMLVHTCPTSGRHFVQWPKHIEDTEALKQLFDTWCLGTAYTAEKGPCFGHLYNKAPPEKFVRTMRQFDILIAH